MTISNLVIHEKLPFEDYRQLSGMSFSGTKTFTPIVPTFKMKLGTALDQYLTEPEKYDGFEYDMIRKAAPLVRQKMGGLWNKLEKQLSYTCTMKYKDFELLHKGRPDFCIPGKIVIDLKYVEDKAAIERFDYPSQLSGYSLSLNCPMAFILEMSRKRNEAKLIACRISSEFWERQILLRGNMVDDY